MLLKALCPTTGRAKGKSLACLPAARNTSIPEEKNMQILKEFKEFAMRGNVVDMAIGIIIGSAFGKIVSSLVQDVIMPPIGLIMGNVDFSNLVLTLREKGEGVEAVTLKYGVFINTILDFTIVAFAIFMLIKQMNRLKKKEEAAVAEPTTKECPHCCSAIPLKAVRCPQCTSEL
jgi:large conductance mechanosensitive channel